MKFKTLCYVSVALTSLSMAAVAQTPGVSSSGMGMAAATSSSSPAGVSAQDKTFATEAAQAGLAEVQEGQIALQKGGSTVKTIGQRMVTDHTKANGQLQTIAQNLGLTLPTALTATQQAQCTKLQGMSGKDFDTAYLRDQHKAHDKVISLFQQEQDNGQNKALTDFAKQALPMLKTHLKMIKDAQ